jgi:hypothetical protein
MMFIVAVVAVGLASLPVLVDLLSDDGPFNAVSRVTRSWNCEYPPSITVDVFEGSIDVLPSSDGQVSAKIMCGSVTPRSHWPADRALITIDVTTSRQGNDIQIVVDRDRAAAILRTTDGLATGPRRGRSDQYASALITSPPLIVPRA